MRKRRKVFRAKGRSSKIILSFIFRLPAFEFSASLLLLLRLCILILLCAAPLLAQRIAFLTPDKSLSGQKFRENLETILSKEFQLLDDSLAETVSQNLAAQNIFNLTTEEARNFGGALGSNFFVLLKAETLRRSISAKPGFYIESYAAVYLISSRTGRLIFWKLPSFQSPTAAESEKKLKDSLEFLAQEISENLKAADKREREEISRRGIEELPDESSEAAKNFRSPLPYRRLKPKYTALANLYSVTATVDASVELDEKGNVERVEITRWAGYGLDESVAATIRKMQWRAATRDGKSLPIRVLLRYNFKKIDHSDD